MWPSWFAGIAWSLTALAGSGRLQEALPALPAKPSFRAAITAVGHEYG